MLTALGLQMQNSPGEVAAEDLIDSLVDARAREITSVERMHAMRFKLERGTGITAASEAHNREITNIATRQSTMSYTEACVTICAAMDEIYTKHPNLKQVLEFIEYAIDSKATWSELNDDLATIEDKRVQHKAPAANAEVEAPQGGERSPQEVADCKKTRVDSKKRTKPDDTPAPAKKKRAK